MKGKLLSCALAAAFLLSICGMPSQAADTQSRTIGGVEVSQEFYTAIAALLNVPSGKAISADDVAGLTGNVDLSGIGLVDTRGMRLLTGASSINLLDNNIVYVGSGDFKDMTNLKTVKLPTALTQIGEDAFSGDSSLYGLFAGDSADGGVTFPSNIMNIVAGAFNGAAFTKISMFQSFDLDIGDKAFANEPKLKTVVLNYTDNCAPRFAMSAFEGDSVRFSVESSKYMDYAQNSNFPAGALNYQGHDYFKHGGVSFDLSALGVHSLSVPASELNFTGGVSGFDFTYSVKPALQCQNKQYVTIDKNSTYSGGLPVTGLENYNMGGVTYSLYSPQPTPKDPNPKKFPQHAKYVSLNRMGALIYTPETDFTGTDTLLWKVSTGANEYNGIIVITVKDTASGAGSGTGISSGNSSPVQSNPKTGDSGKSAYIFVIMFSAAFTALGLFLSLKHRKS